MPSPPGLRSPSASSARPVARGRVRSITRPIRAFQLNYIPVVVVYFAYGALGLIDVTRDLWIKESLSFTPSQLAGIGVWLTLPWTVKMVFGELVDTVPVFGSQRKSYILIGALLMATGLLILAGAVGRWLTFGRPDTNRTVVPRRAKTRDTESLTKWQKVIGVCLLLFYVNNCEIAGVVGVTRQTVRTWRDRFAKHRLNGIDDEPRCGAPRKIGDDRIEEIVTKTLETKPADATHWSTRGMAKAAGVSASSVHRIWQAFCLQPHRTETFKLSTDPQFVEKVRDIVELYRPRRRWSSASMKRAKYKPLIERSLFCRCVPVRSRGALTTTSATARRHSSQA